MKHRVKHNLNMLCKALMLPLAIPCIIEKRIWPDSEILFNMCAQMVALLPGIPGVFLRRGFYNWTLEHCSLDSHIGFGTVFSHREARVEDNVYIGSYALIGSAHLQAHCLIGSRTSILSGKALHVIGDDGLWTPYSADRLTRVVLGKNVWIGESAVIVSDVGENSMIGAGAVVTTAVKPGVIVTGNPARYVGKVPIDHPTQMDSGNGPLANTPPEDITAADTQPAAPSPGV